MIMRFIFWSFPRKWRKISSLPEMEGVSGWDPVSRQEPFWCRKELPGFRSIIQSAGWKFLCRIPAKSSDRF